MLNRTGSELPSRPPIPPGDIERALVAELVAVKAERDVARRLLAEALPIVKGSPSILATSLTLAIRRHLEEASS